MDVTCRIFRYKCSNFIVNNGKVDIIVCCGGDGTLNETISGVMQAGLHTPIGYIPAGSTNDLQIFKI